MTEILFAVSPSVFSRSMLDRAQGVLWPISRRTHSARVAVVALVVTGLVDICSECRARGDHVKAPVILPNAQVIY